MQVMVLAFLSQKQQKLSDFLFKMQHCTVRKQLFAEVSLTEFLASELNIPDTCFS